VTWQPGVDAHLYKVTGDLRDPKTRPNLRKVRAGTTADRYPIELDIGAAFRQARAARGLQDCRLVNCAMKSNGCVIPAFIRSGVDGSDQRVAAAVACVALR